MTPNIRLESSDIEYQRKKDKIYLAWRIWKLIQSIVDFCFFRLLAIGLVVCLVITIFMSHQLAISAAALTGLLGTLAFTLRFALKQYSEPRNGGLWNKGEQLIEKYLKRKTVGGRIAPMNQRTSSVTHGTERPGRAEI